MRTVTIGQPTVLSMIVHISQGIEGIVVNPSIIAEQTDGGRHPVGEVVYEGFADGAEVPFDGLGDGPTPVGAQHQAGAGLWSKAAF